MIKRIPIKEFRELGFLQEANRLFFHPHGLALEITHCDTCDGTGKGRGVYEGEASHCPSCGGKGSWISGVWDSRDDPEGIVFGSGDDRVEKAASVAAERQRHSVARAKLFGLDEPVTVPGDADDIEPLDYTYKPEGDS